MYEIHLSLTAIHNFTYDELFEFNDSIMGRINPIVNKYPRLQLRYGYYNGAFNSFDRSTKRSRKEPETIVIKDFDSDRKDGFIVLTAAVRQAAAHSIIPEVKAAALALLPIFDLYAGTPKIDYEGETGAIKNLMQDLEKPENVAHIARLGQTENVAALKQININLQAIYEARMQNRYDYKQEGNTRQRAKALTDELVKFCRAVDGLLLSTEDPDEVADLHSIVSIINATMEQYTRTVHQRLGILAAKKKNDKKEEGKGDGKTDSGTQTPDTAKPPAPNTPPQKPDTTNPTVDPDELNPPAVGEH